MTRRDADAGLTLAHRWSTWERELWDDGGYVVNVHVTPDDARGLSAAPPSLT